MVIYLKAGGGLRDRLQPDVDHYTRRVETEEGRSVREILEELGIHPGFVAYVYTGSKVKKLDYIPIDGETVTLQPPVSGG